MRVVVVVVVVVMMMVMMMVVVVVVMAMMMRRRRICHRPGRQTSATTLARVVQNESTLVSQSH